MPNSRSSELPEPKLVGGHVKPMPPRGRVLTLVLCGLAAGIYEVRRPGAPRPRSQIGRAHV